MSERKKPRVIFSPEDGILQHWSNLETAIRDGQPLIAAAEGIGLSMARVSLKDNLENNCGIGGVFIQWVDSSLGFMYIPFRCFLAALKKEPPSVKILHPLVKT